MSLLANPTPSNVDWRLNTMTQVVDRGVIPMLGFSVMLLGSWLDAITNPVKTRRSNGVLLTVAFLASAMLSLLYLTIAPLHFRDAGIASSNATNRITQQVEQAEQQLNNQVNQEVDAVANLLQNEAQVNQLRNPNANLTPEQQARLDDLLAQVDEFKKNPGSLQQQAEDTRAQAISRIRLEQQQLESQIRQSFWKSAIRVPVSSLLLTAGYLFIAFNGLKIMGQ